MTGCLKFESELSSSAKADDPVFRSDSDGIDRARRTGYPAFAWYDSFCRGYDVPLFLQLAPPALKRREHRLGDIGGAVAAAEFHPLYAIRLGLVPPAPDALAPLSRAFWTVLVRPPVPPHLRRENHTRRVGPSLPPDI